MRETSIAFKRGRRAAGITAAVLILFGGGIIFISYRIESRFVLNSQLNSIAAQLSLAAKAIEKIYQNSRLLPQNGGETAARRSADWELGQLGVRLKTGELIFIEDLLNPQTAYIKTERDIKNRDEKSAGANFILRTENKDYIPSVPEAEGYRFVAVFDKVPEAEHRQESAAGKGAVIYTIAGDRLGYSDITAAVVGFEVNSPIFAYILLFFGVTAAGGLAAATFISKLLKPHEDVYNALNRIVMGDFAFRLPAGDHLVNAYNTMVEKLNASKKSSKDSTILEKRAEEELKKYRIHLDYKLLESSRRSEAAIKKLSDELEKIADKKAVFEYSIRKNMFAIVASAAGFNLSKWWAEKLVGLKAEIRTAKKINQEAYAAQLQGSVGKIKEIIREVGAVENLFQDRETAAEFSVSVFYQTCSRYMKIFERDDIPVTVNFTGEDSDFFGYERFYTRTLIFFVGYAAYNALLRKTEEPEITVNIWYMPEMLRFSIMDNCRIESDSPVEWEYYAIDKGSLLIRFYIDMLGAYGGALSISKVGRGLCYLFEFNGLGEGYAD
jgi:hypothetical protein